MSAATSIPPAQTAIAAALGLLSVKMRIIDAIPQRTRRLTPEEVEEVDRELLNVSRVLARIKEAVTLSPPDQNASMSLFRELASALQHLEELTVRPARSA